MTRRVFLRRRQVPGKLPRSLRFAIGLVVLLAGAGCHRDSVAPPLPGPAVLTTRVELRPEPAIVRRGVVAKGARLRLGFSSPGVIAKIAVKTGDTVKKGQLLARLEDGGTSAMLRAAQANRERAIRDQGAVAALVESGALPRAQSDDARAMLKVANANASLAAESMSQRKLLAPITGTVVQRLAEPGEVVGPGMPVLLLDDTQRSIVRVGVTEREVADLSISQPASLVLQGGAEVSAAITSIAPAPLADGLYPVEVTPATGGPQPFRTGTLVDVKLGASAAPKIRIPLDALAHRDGKTFAFVVAGATANQSKVQLREILVDRMDDKDVVVRAGLTQGERIVREGAYFLENDQAVRLLD